MLHDLTSAEEELAGLSPVGQRHPKVLDLRWQIRAAGKDWVGCLRVADQLVAAAPDDKIGWIHRSYSLHELKRTQEAWENLRPVAERYPAEPIIAYNLACYACQLGRHQEAWTWLQAAARRGDPDRVREMAEADPDLRPLWPEMPRLGGAGKS